MLLAAAVAEIYLLYSWPVSFVAMWDQEFVRQLAATVAVTAGCVFTLLLLSVFVPVWLVHDRWIAKALEAAPKPEGWEREKWLKQFNLDSSPLSWFGRAISTLAPTILGLIFSR